MYVDNILIVGTDMDSITVIKGLLHDKFKIKDLGSPKFVLGIEVARSSKGISLYQQKYVLDRLQDSDYLGCKAAKTHLE